MIEIMLENGNNDAFVYNEIDRLAQLSRVDLPVTVEPPKPTDSPITVPKDIKIRGNRWHGRGTRAVSPGPVAKTAGKAFIGGGVFGAFWYILYNIGYGTWSDYFPSHEATTIAKAAGQAFLVIGTLGAMMAGIWTALKRERKKEDKEITEAMNQTAKLKMRNEIQREKNEQIRLAIELERERQREQRLLDDQRQAQVHA